MRADYKQWLQDRKYQENTVGAQIHRVRKVEEAYGDLDEQYKSDRLKGIIEELRYSTFDERQGKPNPSKILFSGNIRNNLASYRNATERYLAFLDESDDTGSPVRIEIEEQSGLSETVDQTAGLFGLERDMQIALRSAISDLEPGLTIADEGVERHVASGFIDITARDSEGNIVVVELKAGKARKDAIVQILSYMGDLALEEPDCQIRGILVASDFDPKVQSSARVVPSLLLKKYSFQFKFLDG
ncbi:MAG: DUF91 domain-containing protein [Alphaproteobacteria bacterium]|nr:MAG: DUF91 domain-containing protein [Alphaproteobacteria bacterium]